MSETIKPKKVFCVDCKNPIRLPSLDISVKWCCRLTKEVHTSFWFERNVYETCFDMNQDNDCEMFERATFGDKLKRFVKVLW